jgi:hypothetical protein
MLKLQDKKRIYPLWIRNDLQRPLDAFYSFRELGTYAVPFLDFRRAGPDV